MKYNFDEKIDRSGRFTSKWEPDAPCGEYIYMGTADMDFRCSQAIQEALQKVVDFNLYGYTHLSHEREGGMAYFETVASHLERQSGWKVKPEHILYVAGALQGASKALQQFTEPGDGVIINRPVYNQFDTIILGQKRTIVDCHLLCDENGYYTIDFEDLERKAADPRNTAYILCSPHNPVGRVWTKEELLRVHDICRRNDVLIICDEVHADFIWGDNRFYSLADVTGGKGVVTCTGFSKTFNLASLHPAHIVITDEELLPVLRRSCWMDPSNFTTESVKAAVTDPTGWLEQVRDYLKGNIDTALRLISELLPKAKCRHPEGSYLLWIDFSGYGLSDEELQQRIFGEAKVALSVGSRLDPGRSECFRRMTVACPRAELIQALERIAEVLK